MNTQNFGFQTDKFRYETFTVLILQILQDLPKERTDLSRIEKSKENEKLFELKCSENLRTEDFAPFRDRFVLSTID